MLSILAGDNDDLCELCGEELQFTPCVIPRIREISLLLLLLLLLRVPLLLLSMPPAAIDATAVTAKGPVFLFVDSFIPGDSFAALDELLLLSVLFPLKYLGGGWTVADVIAEEEGFEFVVLWLDVIFFGDEWKPNRFLLALIGLMVAVGGILLGVGGGIFFLMDGEGVFVAFIDIFLLPIPAD